MKRDATVVDLTGEPDESQVACHLAHTPTTDSGHTAPLRFWNGAVRLTRPSGVEPNPDRFIDFDDILEPGDLSFAVLSAYCVDMAWLMPKLTAVPKVYIVTNYDKSEDRAGTFPVPGYPNATCIFPPFKGPYNRYGVMHSKILILGYPQRLRIGISTANLIEYDYAQVQNMVFLQDLQKSATGPRSGQCQFQSALIEQLSMFCLSYEPTVRLLESFDWSLVKAVLVNSSPSTIRITNNVSTLRSGLLMLSQVSPLSRSELLPSDIVLEYQGSSIGRFTDDWAGQMLSCVVGRLPSKPFITRKRKTVSAAEPDGEMPAVDNFKIIFPTLKYVLGSPTGPGGFGTIFCHPSFGVDTEDRSKYKLFYASKSTVLPHQAVHAKIMVVSRKNALQTPALIYVGSHNCTIAAWGRFTNDRNSFTTSNYETGVLLCPQDFDLGAFPFPYKRPVQQYTVEDIPWVQSIHYM